MKMAFDYNQIYGGSMKYGSLSGRKTGWFVLLLSAIICLIVQPGYADSSQEAIKVTIIPHRSNLGNEEVYSRLFAEMEKETGLKFVWVGSKSYDDVILKIKSGVAQIGYVGPFAYVAAQDSFGVKLICRSLNDDGLEFYNSMIITRKDSGIRRIEDLKGKTIAFTDPKSTSGYLFPLAQLLKEGIALTDFSDVKFLKKHANSLLAVQKGHVDAGATSYTALKKVDVDMDDLRIIWKSEPIYRGPWIASTGLSEEVFSRIQAAMLKIGEPGRPESEMVFEELTTKGFIEAKDSDYDNVREVVRWVENR
jgi:phosphonate transport system substrate-binding protein